MAVDGNRLVHACVPGPWTAQAGSGSGSRRSRRWRHSPGPRPRRHRRSSSRADPRVSPAALTAFADCADLLRPGSPPRCRLVGPYGWQTGDRWPTARDRDRSTPRPPQPPRATRSAPARPAPTPRRPGSTSPTSPRPTAGSSYASTRSSGASWSPTSPARGPASCRRGRCPGRRTPTACCSSATTCWSPARRAGAHDGPRPAACAGQPDPPRRRRPAEHRPLRPRPLRPGPPPARRPRRWSGRHAGAAAVRRRRPPGHLDRPARPAFVQAGTRGRAGRTVGIAAATAHNREVVRRVDRRGLAALGHARRSHPQQRRLRRGPPPPADRRGQLAGHRHGDHLEPRRPAGRGSATALAGAGDVVYSSTDRLYVTSTTPPPLRTRGLHAPLLPGAVRRHHDPRLRADRRHPLRRLGLHRRHRPGPLVARRARRPAARGRRLARPRRHRPGRTAWSSSTSGAPGCVVTAAARARPRRGDPVGALVRRPRRPGHLPADRPALHRRPHRPGPTAVAGRAEDPRLLLLPAPDRRRPAARAGHRGRPPTAPSAARRPPSSTSRTRPARGRSTRSPSARAPGSARPRTRTPSPGCRRRRPAITTLQRWWTDGVGRRPEPAAAAGLADGELSTEALPSPGGWTPRALPLPDGRVALTGRTVRLVRVG